MQFRKSIWFLSLIGLMVLSSSVFAQQYGDFTYRVSGGTIIITEYNCTGGVPTNPAAVIPATIDGMPVIGIGDYAFSQCFGLTSVTIPNSVTRIEDYAFYECDALTSVTIPDSVTRIGEHAFYHCTSLTSVTIGNGVTSIGFMAFQYCTSLTSIVIPDSVTSIGDEAFEYCTNLTSANIGNGVTSIGSHAFGNCSGLTCIVIPDSVTMIGVAAFYNCTSLTSVTIGNGVTHIEAGAFSNCTSLTNIVVDPSNTAYSSQAGVLYNKSRTVLIRYPNTKSGGFTIPDSVISIHHEAFSYCTNLTSVTIPHSVEYIYSWAFFSCTSLTSVIIPGSVTSIGYGAFGNCSGLTSVTIGNSVTSIGSYAFHSCTALTSVTIPSNVTSIGEDTFYGCSGLTSIVVDPSNAAYSSRDGVLYSKDKAVLVEYPSGISGSFIIPNSVKSIRDRAFHSCTALTSVTIPHSVKRIEYGAFYSCTSLTTAYFLGNAPLMDMGFPTDQGEVPYGVFDYCANNFTICYTAGSKGFTTPTWYGYPARVCEDDQCATEAIYGENSEQTELLREYRDKVLSKTPEGQEIIKTYYKFSQTITNLLEQGPLLKNRAKAFIDSMLPSIREKVEESNEKP